MRKVFFLTALLMMILTATAFAEEVATEEANAEEVSTEEVKDEPYVYTSEDFKFTITCPIKPLAVVQNPWQEPEKRGELLVFANEGFDIQYGYIVQVNAFETDQVPDFNKGTLAAIGEYLKDLKEKGGYAEAKLVNITKNNKGVSAITAEKIEVINPETGEVDGEFVADKQYIYTFFRTPEGRCVSVQLISASFDKTFVNVYRGSVASFKDNSKDKKSNKKDKKDKK